MKKLKFFTIFLLLSMFVSLSTASASEVRKSEKSTETISHKNTLSVDAVTILKLRLEEIRDMDKSALTLLEKGELRKELKTIKKDLRNNNGVVYIGTGTLLLVIILIILLV